VVETTVVVVVGATVVVVVGATVVVVVDATVVVVVGDEVDAPVDARLEPFGAASEGLFSGLFEPASTMGPGRSPDATITRTARDARRRRRGGQPTFDRVPSADMGRARLVIDLSSSAGRTPRVRRVRDPPTIGTRGEGLERARRVS